jgi:hypothetical protein
MQQSQSERMEGETQKIDRALLTFDKTTTIPMVRWNFERAGFRLNPSDLMGAMIVDPTRVLERSDVAELPFDDSFIYLKRLHPNLL